MPNCVGKRQNKQMTQAATKVFSCEHYNDQQKAFETLAQYRADMFGVNMDGFQNFQNGFTSTPLIVTVSKGDEQSILYIKYGIEGTGLQYAPMLTTTISWHPDGSDAEHDIVFTKQTGLVVGDDLLENVESLHRHIFGTGTQVIKTFASVVEPFRQILDLKLVETVERQIDMATLTQHTDIEYFKTALAILNTVVDLEYSEIGKNK